MELSKKNRIIISTVVAAVLIVLAVVGFFMAEKNKPFPSHTETGFAMGSPVTVKTFGNVDGETVAKEIIQEAKRLDGVLSNKTETSDISRLNSGETLTLDSFTADALRQTQDIYSKTEGKAALTVGSLSKLWDFDSGKNTVPAKSDIEKALSAVNEANLSLSEDNVASVSGESVLDLGSVGKGLACDRAKQLLSESEIENAVVAVGGSVYAKGYTAKDKKINVGIRNPFGDENDYFGYLSLSDAFVSTSGNYEKAFEKDGKIYHHLLDCTTGYPVDNKLASVTVVCKNGAKSDALSTACYVLGFTDSCLELLNDNNASAIFVYKDKSVKVCSRLESSFTLTDDGFTVSYYVF